MARLRVSDWYDKLGLSARGANALCRAYDFMGLSRDEIKKQLQDPKSPLCQMENFGKTTQYEVAKALGVKIDRHPVKTVIQMWRDGVITGDDAMSRIYGAKQK